MPDTISRQRLDQLKRELADAYDETVPHLEAPPVDREAPDWMKAACYLLTQQNPEGERVVFTVCQCDQHPARHCHLLGTPGGIPELAKFLRDETPSP